MSHFLYKDNQDPSLTKTISWTEKKKKKEESHTNERQNGDKEVNRNASYFCHPCSRLRGIVPVRSVDPILLLANLSTSEACILPPGKCDGEQSVEQSIW